MKRWKIAVLAVSVCLIPIAVAAWSIGSGTSTFGPLHRNSAQSHATEAPPVPLRRIIDAWRRVHRNGARRSRGAAWLYRRANSRRALA